MKSDEAAHPLEQISAFSDGELSSEEAVQVQDHLRSCPDCRQVLHDIRRMSAAVGEEAVPAAPAGLAASIRRRLEAGSEAGAIRKKVSVWKSPFPLATAAALILVTVAYLGWRRELPRRSAAGADVSTSSNVPSVPSESVPPRTEAEKKGDSEPPAPVDSGIAGGLIADRDKEGARPQERHQELDERMKRDDQAPTDNEKVETTDSLYSADGRDAKAKSSSTGGPAAAAPLNKQSALSEPARARPPQAAGKDAAADEETAAGAMAQELSGAAEGAGGEARSLVYEGPDFSATFAEDGLITVITRGYACSVSVAALASPPPAGRPGPKTVEDLPSLFAAAVSKEFLAAPSRPQDLIASQEAARQNLLSSLTLRDGKGDPLHAVAFAEPLQEGTPEIVRTLRQGMQRVFGVRYRAELEGRCGPLPPLLAPAR